MVSERQRVIRITRIFTIFFTLILYCHQPFATHLPKVNILIYSCIFKIWSVLVSKICSGGQTRVSKIYIFYIPIVYLLDCFLYYYLNVCVFISMTFNFSSARKIIITSCPQAWPMLSALSRQSKKTSHSCGDPLPRPSPSQIYSVQKIGRASCRERV